MQWQKLKKLPRIANFNMAKKTFVSRARLVKGARWHIDFQRFDPATGEETRHRQDFDLNEIEDLEVRERVGERLVQNIEVFAQAPVPRNRHIPEKAESQTVKEAVEFALTLKRRLPRQNSIRKYETVAKAFLAWCQKMHYAALPVGEFGRKQARAYWDNLTTRRDYRGRTLNNYLATLRALWSEMMERDMVGENPWAKIKPVRNEEKLRRPFTEEERRVVAAHIEATDYWLFRGVLLQFFCYIRPVELIRLKFRDFDLGKGLVTVLEGNAKSWRKQVKTIPASVMHYFRDGIFDKQPGNYHLFGRVGEGARAKMQPAAKPIDAGRPYKRHARALARLKADGRLTGDISGLTWYSWKDTGISMHTRRTSPVATKDQAGHATLAVTSLYYHAPDENPEYRALENDLF